MQTGISTASLFGRYNTEDGLRYLSDNGVRTAEVFLESFCEYTRDFGKILKDRKGGTEVHSVHTLTLQYEPQLYSLNERAMRDSFKLLDDAMCAAEEVGAKYYTFHGAALVKKVSSPVDFERIGRITLDICGVCANHGVSLAYENVHWCYYNRPGFFKELKKFAPDIKGTLDIKQARQSGVDYSEFLKEMGKDVVTVHLSDVDANGKMCLPGKGTTDFYELFSKLCDYGFNGAALIECYKNDFNETQELFESLEYLNEIKRKVYGLD